MGSKSYVEGWQYSAADSEVFAKFTGCPDAKKAPHAYRWYVHIAAIAGVRGLASAAPAAAAPPATPSRLRRWPWCARAPDFRLLSGGNSTHGAKTKHAD